MLRFKGRWLLVGVVAASWAMIPGIAMAQEPHISTMQPMQPCPPSPTWGASATLQYVWDSDVVSNCKFFFDGAECACTYDHPTRTLHADYDTSGLTNASAHTYSFSCTVYRHMMYFEKTWNLSTTDPLTGSPGHLCDLIIADLWVDRCDISDEYDLWYFGVGAVPDPTYDRPAKGDTPVTAPAAAKMGTAEQFQFRFGPTIPADLFRYDATLSLMMEPAVAGWPVTVTDVAMAKENTIDFTLPGYVYPHQLKFDLNIDVHFPNANTWVPLWSQGQPFLSHQHALYATVDTPSFPPYLRTTTDLGSEQTVPWVSGVSSACSKVAGMMGGGGPDTGGTDATEAARRLARHIYVWGNPPNGPSQSYTYSPGSAVYWFDDAPYDTGTWYYKYQNTHGGMGGNCEDYAALIECNLRALGISAEEVFIHDPDWPGNPNDGYPLNDHKLCGSSFWTTGAGFAYHNVPRRGGGIDDTALAFRNGNPPPADWRLAEGEAQATYQTDLTADTDITWSHDFSIGNNRQPPWRGTAHDSRVEHYLYNP